MFKFFKICLPFFSPEGANSGSDVSDATIKSDIDLLTPETEEEAKEEKEVEEEAEKEAEDKVDEEETEEKESKEEDTEDKEELARVDYRDLKNKFDGKYKDLFKDFPQLKPAFFREQQFSAVFATPEEAREAAKEVLQFQEFKDITLGGNAESLLTQINEASPAGLKKLAINFLPALSKLSSDAYINVTTPVIKDVLRQVYAHGKQIEDKDIMNAAQLAHHTIFGDVELGKPAAKAEQSDEEKEWRAEQARESSLKQKSLIETVVAHVDGALNKEIEKGLDPTNSLRPGLKKLLIERINTEVRKALESDSQHNERMGLLWEKERRAGFKGANKDSITIAFLSRAKALIPKIRADIRKDVLADQKDSDTSLDKKVQANKTKNIPVGNASKNGSKVIPIKEARDKKMSDMDIIMAGGD